MLAGELSHLIGDVALAQQVSKLMVADNRVVVRAAGHKNECGVLRLGFFREQKNVVLFAGFALCRAKNVSKAKTLEPLVILGVPRSRARAAQASGKEKQPGILQREIDGRIA